MLPLRSIRSRSWNWSVGALLVVSSLGASAAAAPQIGAAKSVLSAPVNNGDGTYSLTYRIFVENSGDQNLSGLQVIDALATSFATAVSFGVSQVTSPIFTVNPSYNGTTNMDLLTGADSLASGGSGAIDVTLIVTPGPELGPYTNIAMASATSDSLGAVSDLSTNGTFPDANGNGDPGDDSTPTTITFTEAPRIGVAKRLLATPTNNGNGTYTLSYRILVANSGDVPVLGVQIADNLGATFTGAAGFTVNSVTSTDFTVNPVFNGTTISNLLTGTDGLPAGLDGTVDLTVTVTPGTKLGPYANSATGSATSAGGASLSDVSADGQVPDQNGNGNPGDDSSPTPVTFAEAPRIGVAKRLLATPTNNGNGTYTLSYRILIANGGDVPVTGVQLTDNLSTTFAGATGFSVGSVTSAGFTVNPTFNGTTTTALLSGAPSLAPGQSGSVDLTVTVTPGTKLGPYANSATGSATSAGGASLTDISADGQVPDQNGNGDPGDDSSPTPVTFSEAPQIGVAKRVFSGPTNNGNGTYTLTYRIRMVNSGDVAVSNVQMRDDLNAAFAGAVGYTVTSVVGTNFTANPAYNGSTDTALLAGSNTLAAGTAGAVNVTLTVTPGTKLGPYSNSASGSATSPAGASLADVSTNGTLPDANGNGNPGDDSAPTVLTFTEAPEIGVAKKLLAAPTNNSNGTYTLTYRLFIQNSGDVPVTAMQLRDDLATTFTGAAGFSVSSVTSASFTVNPAFNGTTTTALLSGTPGLVPGQSGSVDLTVTVTPGTKLGPYSNGATGSATSAGGASLSDVSADGEVPDQNGNGDPGDDSTPTALTFVEAPRIGVAKRLLATPTNNSDGTYTLTYRLFIQNSGDVPVTAVQLRDDLATTFTGAAGFSVSSVTSASFTVNPAFNGTTTTALLSGTPGVVPGQSGSVDLTVTVTPGAKLGPYSNSATGSATSAGGASISDVSADGATPDQNGNGDPGDDRTPTVVTFVEAPRLGVAKRLLSAPVNNGDGTYTLTYRLFVQNSGDVPVTGVQLRDDLDATFASGLGFAVVSVTSAELAVNSAYDGVTKRNLLAGTNTFAIGQSGSVDLTVTVTPGSILGPYANSATGSATSAGGAAIADVSADGATPDQNGNGDPGDDSAPTQVTFSEAPRVGVAKRVLSGPVNNGDGTYTLTYRISIENSGDVPVTGVQLLDDLGAAFTGAASFVVDTVTSRDFAVHPGYNGTTSTALLGGAATLGVGQTGAVDVTVTVTPGTNLGPYANSATGSATSSGGASLIEISTDGADPDANGNGDPADDSTPTEISFTEAPQIGVAKRISSGPANNGDGTYTLTYRILVANSGDVPVTGVQLRDDLGATFDTATSFGVDSVTGTGLAVNPGYDGVTDTNLLTGSGGLLPGSSASVDVTLTVTPGIFLGPYENQASGSATSSAGTALSDLSASGNEPDANGDGEPRNDSLKTAVTFTEAPEIGLAKSLLAAPTNNNDGTYSFAYRIFVVNSGDVPMAGLQITDDLSATFGAAQGFVVDAVTGTGLATNPAFDGTSDKNLLLGNDVLAPGASGTVQVDVTLTPGTFLGPYGNAATGSATSPGGTAVADVSTAGDLPDPDGDGNPGNNSTPAGVTFGEAPQLGVAKRVLAGPVNNGDGSYTLTYRLHIANSGDVPVTGVELTDHLGATFAAAAGFTVQSAASTAFFVNPSYNGRTDTALLVGVDSLRAGAGGDVDLMVTVTPGSSLGPYANSAVASATSTGGVALVDQSANGAVPDQNGNGDPSDDGAPTTVSFSESPRLGVAKQVVAGPTNNGDGTYTLAYRLRVQNSGDVPVLGVQITDDLAQTFADVGVRVDSLGSSDLAANPGYDGAADTNLLAGSDALLPGEDGSIDLVVTVTPGANLGPFANSATGNATSAGGAPLADVSADGATPDQNGNGDPGDDSAPTPVAFAESPRLGAAKRLLSSPVNHGDGTYSLSYRIVVENSGDVPLEDVQIQDDLTATFATATSFAVVSVSSLGLSVNPAYDGAASTRLLTGGDVLGPGATGSVDVDLTVTPGGGLGPHANSASASATSPGGAPVADVSADGTAADANGNGDPSDDSAPTWVSFSETPRLGVAKAILAPPTNNGDGTYSFTYRLTIQNSGDTALRDLQIVDDLSLAFAGAAGYAVDAVTSPTLAVNPAYDGTANRNLLLGTDALGTGGTASMDLTVTVTPGANLGPYTNQATGSATSPGGAALADISTDGPTPDQNGNGDPGDDATPTPVSFTEAPEIGVAKAVLASPVNNGDGTYTLTYRILVENTGDVPVQGVQLADDLQSSFAAATDFQVTAVGSSDLTPNPAYDGRQDTELLLGGDMLPPGGTGTVDLTVTVTPGATLGPYANSATGSATSPAGAALADLSANGPVPDANGNGDPGDDSAPTHLTFGESARIGVAKTILAGSTNNTDGSYSLTYRIWIENSGDVPVHGVQIVDNLATTFTGAVSFSVVGTSSTDLQLDPAYDGRLVTTLLLGADSLATGSGASLDLAVTVVPGTKLGPYLNRATGSATSAGGASLSDISANGTAPDANGNGNPGDDSARTPVTFTEAPRLGVAKSVHTPPAYNGDGTYTLTYRIHLENGGDVPLGAVQLTDDLGAAFATATGFVVNTVTSADLNVDPAYDGRSNANLLAGTDTMTVAAQASLDLTVTVTPGANLGPYANSATGSGRSPGGASVADISTAGTAPDANGNGNPGDDSTPTPVTFTERAQIGVAKSLVSGPLNRGDGTYTLTYRIHVENSGDVPLGAVQLTDDLGATFAAATGFVVQSATSGDFAVNPAYDGDSVTALLTGADALVAGAAGEVDLTVTVTPGGILGPYGNTALGTALSAGGTPLDDASANGATPDANGNGDPGDDSSPTPVSFTESPQLGVAKAVLAGPASNGDGTSTLTYRILIQNSGDVPLRDVQASDDLRPVFTGAVAFAVDSVRASGLTVNPSYDGATATTLLSGTDTLAPGTSASIDVTVSVTPGAKLGPYNNQVIAWALSSGGTSLSDLSTQGSVPDANGDGNPLNDSRPTPVTFGEAPEIGVAKAVQSGPTDNGDGSHTLTYRLRVENSGDTPLAGLQLTDDLAATFAQAVGFAVSAVSSPAFTVAPGYDGRTLTNLLAGTDTLAPGAAGHVDLTLVVTPGANRGPYGNVAAGSGTSPAGVLRSDTSTAGAVADANGNGDPGDDSTPTTVSFGETASIGVAKRIVAGPVNHGDGTYTLTYRLLVANGGDVPLQDVTLVDDLAAAFAGAASFAVDSLTSAGLPIDPAYDGAANTGLLLGGATLTAGASASCDLTVTVTPGANLGPYANSATTGGRSPGGTLLADVSTNGALPDANGNGDPGDDGEPTPVAFEESPRIGVAKLLVSLPASNGDGTHTVTYRLRLANTGDVALGDVQLTDDLGATFAPATAFGVDSLASADFAVNPDFDGRADTNLLLPGAALAPGASGSVEVTVTVTPGTNLGPYGNTAWGRGSSPAGAALADASTDGADPDANGNGDPGDDSMPTFVTFGATAKIGVAKAVVAGPVNHGDGTYTVTYVIAVENTGGTSLTNLQVYDDTRAAFAQASNFAITGVRSNEFKISTSYDGGLFSELLTGTDILAPGARGSIELSVRVTPGAMLGPYENSAFGEGLAPGGLSLADQSTDGSVPDANGNGDPQDDRTPTSVTFREAPLLGIAMAVSAGPIDHGDGTHSLTYLVTVANLGDIEVRNLQVTDSLGAAFAAAADFRVDALTSAEFAVSPAYDGKSNVALLLGNHTLAPGARGTLRIDLTVVPGGFSGPYANGAAASATSPAGSVLADLSQAGLDPDGNGNGDPGDDSAPTLVSFAPPAGLGAAKAVTSGPVNLGDGTYRLTYSLLLQNAGQAMLRQVRLSDDLAASFAAAAGFVVEALRSTSFAVNPGFDGSTDVNLLAGTDSLDVGAAGSVELQLRVRPGSSLGPYENVAFGQGWTASGLAVNDGSTAGTTPDQNGNGDPGDDQVATAVTFLENPSLGLAKGVQGQPQRNADGTWTVTYVLVVANLGDVPLHALQIADDLGTTFASAASFQVQSATSADLEVNSSFDGRADTNLLAGTDSLAVGQSATLTLAVAVTPSEADDAYANSALASAASPAQKAVSDLSTSGLLPDPDGNGNPGDNDEPTPVRLQAVPAVILLTKAADRATLTAGDFVRYTLVVENTTSAPQNDIVVRDVPPPGFTYAAGTARAQRDGEAASAFEPQGARTLEFPPLDLAAGERVQIHYVLRAGSGVTLGVHVNRATPYQDDAPVGNTASASVERLADPALERTTVVGKVFHDRDGDGWQETAAASGVLIHLDFDGAAYVSGSSRLDRGDGTQALDDVATGSPFADAFALGELPAAASLGSAPPRIVASVELATDRAPQIEVTSREGTVLRLDAGGTTTTHHKGRKLRGLTGQDLVVTRSLRSEGGTRTLEIQIENRGMDEEGIAGARLATATGLVIRTDEFGRYHIADVDAGSSSRGRNFILKVDPASLPKGARCSTENPRVLHLTPGLMNRIDFGVRRETATLASPTRARAETELRLKKSIQPWLVEPTWNTGTAERIDLGRKLFPAGSAELRAEGKPRIAEVAKHLKNNPEATASIEGHSESAKVSTLLFTDAYELSIARARAVMYELVLNHGIDMHRLSAVGFGADRVKSLGKRAKVPQCIAVLTSGSVVAPKVVAVTPDTVEVALQVGCRGDMPLDSLAVLDFLPAGIRYVEGSCSVGGIASADPSRAEREGGSVLRWQLPSPIPATGVAITYRARLVSIDAAQELVSTAQLHWQSAGGDRGASSAVRTPIGLTESAPGRVEHYSLGSADFGTGAAALTSSAEEALTLVAGTMAGMRDVQVTIEGHTDSQTLPSPPYRNHKELSEARADQVRQFLQRLVDLGDERFTMRGYGATRPVDNNFTRMGRQRNQRVEIVLMEKAMPARPAARDSSPDAPYVEQTTARVYGFSEPGALQGGSVPPGSMPSLSVPPGSMPSLSAPPSASSRHRGEGLDPSLAPLDEHAAGHADRDGARDSDNGETSGASNLPWGGTVWAVEDPGRRQLQLAIHAVRGEAAGSGLHFTLSTNYHRFIQRWEIVLYRGADDDLVLPLHTLDGGAVRPTASVDWDAAAAGLGRAGDEIQFVLRAHDAQGRMDETFPGRILWLGDAAGEVRIEPGETALRRQSIPVRGGHVQVRGAHIPAGVRLQVAREPVSVAYDGSFVLDWLLPAGPQEIGLFAANERGEEWSGALHVDARDSWFFMVGMADIAAGDNSISGDATLAAQDPQLGESLFGTARLAFYLKGAWRGRYQATAQLDTREDDLKDLFANIDRRDPRSLFRHLDPDRHYLTYGDGSTTTSDVNTQGRMYARFGWDKSALLWGNYATGFTGTEFGQYNRSLYGGSLAHRSLQTTRQGDAKVEGAAFVSEAQTAFGHVEFLGTGGSLYYLEHGDIVQGSAKVWVEVRDRDSDRVLENVTLQLERDYEIDELQGRLILRRPLLQVADQVAPSIIKDTPLDGNRLLLLVDYEYVPAAWERETLSYGVRGKVWAVDNLGAGGTYVQEDRDGQDYRLAAGDATLRAGRGTYLKTEYAESEAQQSRTSSYSDDGGLTFAALTPGAAPARRSGAAVGLEGRLDLPELLQNESSPRLAGWWKRRDAGFSTARLETQRDTQQYGAELLWRWRERFSLGSRWSVTDEKDAGLERALSLQGETRWSRWQLGGEVRQRREETGGTSGEALLGGARLGVDLRPGISLYSKGQLTLQREGSAVENDMGSLGIRARVSPDFHVDAEGSAGSRGQAARVGADFRFDARRELYGTYTLSTDRADGARGVLSIGQRTSLSNQLRVFTEHQFAHSQTQPGQTQAYGVSYKPRDAWSLDFSYQRSQLDAAGAVDRDAASVSLALQKARARLSLKGEFRNDDGAVDRRAWLTTNRMDLGLGRGWTLLGKVSASRTEDLGGTGGNAQFVESGFGLAFRPERHSRLNLLGRYTFLLDLPAASQSERADERSHVVSLDAGYDLTRRLEVGGRVARKRGEIRQERAAGDWTANQPDLAVLRLRYHLPHALEGVGEYRWLRNEWSGDRQSGALLALYRPIAANLQLGAGFNASRFSDDLTSLDYDAYGWFVRLIGKY